MTLEQFKSDIISQRQKLLAVAWRMLANEADAEDAVQEVFLRLWSIRGQLDTISNPGGFAMQTTKNICIDKLRMQRTTVDPENVFLGFEEKTPYHDTEKQDSVGIVRRIIDNLPELQRKIIMMRDVEGYELQEIADITGSQTNAVTMNLSRARKKVRDEFIRINAYYKMKEIKK
ncbi:MAG: sigma-70 family RNA polymerase sigma factor [Dysgonamonadaceae bacterium]|jgi:RNA polymerase sigma-70 factor (ECF subfamily)|nr:sigma-70 family RNA polymerase sigma factor [Dysgonamonadaceae bacterium]